MKKFLILCVVVGLIALLAVPAIASAGQPPGKGFNEFGYNYNARIFNGTGESWSLAKGLPADYLGIYAPDKLVMKWNAEWDRGNTEGWNNPPYAAWITNEWNGNTKMGSGEVWHYKIIWVGSQLESSPWWVDGGYAIWGQFEVIMDHGTYPADGNQAHLWFAHGIPNGFGLAGK